VDSDNLQTTHGEAGLSAVSAPNLERFLYFHNFILRRENENENDYREPNKWVIIVSISVFAILLYALVIVVKIPYSFSGFFANYSPPLF